MTDLFLKVKSHYEQQLPFVLFCKPNSDRMVGLFQKNDHLHFLEDHNEMGFIFAPFDGNEIILIPQKESDVIVERKAKDDFYFQKNSKQAPNVIAQVNFEALVQKAINKIETGAFQKVVLSRKETVQLSHFDIEMVFKRLVNFYPTAFNSCFFHPKVGLWIGATPEQLLQVKGQTVHTVALAGTQINKDSDDIFWQEKEKEEQQIVTDYIVNNLQSMVTEITVSKPYTVNAGVLNHIKTDILATIPSTEKVKEVIDTLHPTPAVCGFPKEVAKAFILKNENYNREYYAGFLGEWNLDLASFKGQQTDLFVNLRCMKIVGNQAELFIGCGITKDSNPAKEYLETVNKSITMKNVLDF